MITNNCDICGRESGTSLVCPSCRVRLSPSQILRIRSIWHGKITEGTNECFHCEHTFPEDELCGDHFPYTVGRRKDLEFDLRNGVPCCKGCNNSGSKNRKNPNDYMKRLIMCCECGERRMVTCNLTCSWCDEKRQRIEKSDEMKKIFDKAHAKRMKRYYRWKLLNPTINE